MRLKPLTYRQVLLGSLLATSILLAACEKNAAETSAAANEAVALAEPAAGSVAAKADAAEAADEQTSFKLNGYTEAYNKLIGTFGLPETYESYVKNNIPKQTAKSSISITDGWIEDALNLFKQARALPTGGPEALEQSADKLITALDKLVVQLKALTIYYESKAYKDDNLARGKSEDASLRASFEASTAAMTAFNGALGQEQKKRGVETLARLKASGDLLGYNSKVALGRGEELINLFQNERDMKNAAKYVEGDALVAELEKTLVEQRALYAAAKDKAKDKEAQPEYGHESMASSLVSLVGAYRSLKQSRQARDYDEMIKEYNRAVENANDIE